MHYRFVGMGVEMGGGGGGGGGRCDRGGGGRCDTTLRGILVCNVNLGPVVQSILTKHTKDAVSFEQLGPGRYSVHNSVRFPTVYCRIY